MTHRELITATLEKRRYVFDDSDLYSEVPHEDRPDIHEFFDEFAEMVKEGLIIRETDDVWEEGMFKLASSTSKGRPYGGSTQYPDRNVR